MTDLHPGDVIAQHPTVLEQALAIADADHRDRHGPENSVSPWYLGLVVDHIYPTCPGLRRSLPAGQQPTQCDGVLYPEAGDVCGICLRWWRARRSKSVNPASETRKPFAGPANGVDTRED